MAIELQVKMLNVEPEGLADEIVRLGERRLGFEAPNALLGKMGFVAKSYQENRRVSFELMGAEVEIDSWPLIPPYLEIEGRSREHVVRVRAALGAGEAELTGENTTNVYARYGIDLGAIRELRF